MPEVLLCVELYSLDNYFFFEVSDAGRTVRSVDTDGVLGGCVFAQAGSL